MMKKTLQLSSLSISVKVCFPSRLCFCKFVFFSSLVTVAGCLLVLYLSVFGVCMFFFII